MPNYRRCRETGASFFFTLNVRDRRDGALLVDHIESLRRAVAAERTHRPFRVRAWVVLPDHMHWIWTLPQGDDDYATRWRRIRTNFSIAIPPQEWETRTRRRPGKRAIWQPRYWERRIRDDAELHALIDYVHINPVKHRHVTRTADWPHSSFHAYVARGAYTTDWGCATDYPADLGDR
jgi:putative transposase